MSTVTLNIGPKTYTIACADGEEAHIAGLGAMIAEKYALLGASRAPLEAQNLLFAALFLADELAEARGRPAAAAQAEPAPEPAPATDTAEAAEAERLREIIAKLEQDLAAARKSAAATAPRTDLFADPAPADDGSAALADQLEALAARVEASAAALEAAAASA